MKSLFNLVSIIAITSLLILGGLAGFLVFSGKLDAESASTIAAVLRGESLVPAELLEKASEPRETVKPEPSDPVSLDSIEIQLAMLDREKRAIDDRYARLRDAELKLIRDREALVQKQQTFHNRVEQQQQKAEDEGFEKALTLYTQMPPRLAKEDFMNLDVDIVVRYLVNMPKRNSARILQEFKTPEEQQRRQEITERIRTQQVLFTQGKG